MLCILFLFSTKSQPLYFLSFICFLSFISCISLFVLHICLLSTCRQRIQFTRVLLINSRIQTMDVKLLLFKFVYLSSFCIFSSLCMCVYPRSFFLIFLFYLTSLIRNIAIFSCIGWKLLIYSCLGIWQCCAILKRLTRLFSLPIDNRMSHL